MLPSLLSLVCLTLTTLNILHLVTANNGLFAPEPLPTFAALREMAELEIDDMNSLYTGPFDGLLDQLVAYANRLFTLHSKLHLSALQHSPARLLTHLLAHLSVGNCSLMYVGPCSLIWLFAQSSAR